MPPPAVAESRSSRPSLLASVKVTRLEASADQLVCDAPGW
jgi:hypothetical protein